MAEDLAEYRRHVLRVERDANGKIIAVCGAWGHTPKDVAIRQIESTSQLPIYVVEDSKNRTAEVRVATQWGEKCLAVRPSKPCDVNLLFLPECECDTLTKVLGGLEGTW